MTYRDARGCLSNGGGESPEDAVARNRGRDTSDELARLREENARLREALGAYANRDNWQQDYDLASLLTGYFVLRYLARKWR